MATEKQITTLLRLANRVRAINGGPLLLRSQVENLLAGKSQSGINSEFAALSEALKGQERQATVRQAAVGRDLEVKVEMLGEHVEPADWNRLSTAEADKQIKFLIERKRELRRNGATYSSEPRWKDAEWDDEGDDSPSSRTDQHEEPDPTKFDGPDFS